MKSVNCSAVFRLLSSVGVVLAVATLSACGKPADAPAAAPVAAPAAAAPAASAPADGTAQAAAPVAKPDDKKDAVDPLAHEGIPGLSDMFSKKKEGGGH